MGVESYGLGSVSKKDLNPGKCERREAECDQFGDENVRDCCIKGRAEVHKEHPDIAFLLFQMVQYRVDGNDVIGRGPRR